MHVPSNFAGNEPARWCDAFADDADNIAAATDAGTAAEVSVIVLGVSGADLASAVGVFGAADADRANGSESEAADAAMRLMQMSASVTEER